MGIGDGFFNFLGAHLLDLLVVAGLIYGGIKLYTWIKQKGYISKLKRKAEAEKKELLKGGQKN